MSLLSTPARISPIRLRLSSLFLGLVGITAFLLLWVFIISYLQGTLLDYANYRGLLQRVHVLVGDIWLFAICIWILLQMRVKENSVKG